MVLPAPSPNMKHIYCISGFGADERIFKHLDFGNNEVHFIPWKIPVKGEKLEDYVARMAKNINHPDPILVGVSFGGMICIEIARMLSIEKIILISSIKTYHELPLYMRLAGKSKINKIIPLRPYSFLQPIENYNLGVVTEEEKELARDYRKKINPSFSNWGIHEILNWKNDWHPKNLCHIHGDKDRIFPIKNIKADFVIQGGGHLMLMDKADKINEIFKIIV